MKILLAAGEAVPFCKTGGLADVVGALAAKLGSWDHDVALFLPKYRAVAAPTLEGGVSIPLRVPLGAESASVDLRYLQNKRVMTLFVDHPAFFDREGLYGEGGADYPDNDRRFALFCRAALEGAKAAGFKPDIVHAHDWQAALTASYLKRVYRGDPFFRGTASVLTLHNMAYQGNFPRESLGAAGFSPADFTPEGLEFYGRMSFLKGGLVDADVLTTVSPTYAREITESSERGFGLEGLLAARREDLHGVINGLDTDVWNPESDETLPRRYSLRDAERGKAAAKAELQRRCGLSASADIPLAGIVARFDRQKGLDLALEAVRPRLGRLQLAVLGSGDPALAGAFADLSRSRPRAVHVHEGFNDAFARLVYAASDLFLMPSRFEPCGLGQMIAMRYGSVPVASRTGGLADTVFESPGPAGRPNGFLCDAGDAGSFASALDRALDAYALRSWRERRSAAMECDFSWGPSVARYLEIYEEAGSKAAARGESIGRSA